MDKTPDKIGVRVPTGLSVQRYARRTMEGFLKFAVFVGPAVLAAMIRIMVVVIHGGEELKSLDLHRAKLFDSSTDLLLASTAILAGLLLYAKTGSTLTKPGTAEAIEPGDIISCGIVQGVMLVFILFFSSALPHFLPGYDDALTIWWPDFFGFVALLWSIVKLA